MAVTVSCVYFSGWGPQVGRHFFRRFRDTWPSLQRGPAPLPASEPGVVTDLEGPVALRVF